MKGVCWWVSSPAFTGIVWVEGAVVIGGAPYIKRYIGKSFDTLKRELKVDRFEILSLKKRSDD